MTTEIITEDMLLAELLEIEAEIKPRLKRLELLKQWCKDRGTFSTDNYVCAIKPRSRTCLVSLDKAIEALGKEMLESFSLIQTISFLTVHVNKRNIRMDRVIIKL